MDGVMYWVGVVVLCLFLAVLPLALFGLVMVYRWTWEAVKDEFREAAKGEFPWIKRGG